MNMVKLNWAIFCNELFRIRSSDFYNFRKIKKSELLEAHKNSQQYLDRDNNNINYLFVAKSRNKKFDNVPVAKVIIVVWKKSELLQ